MNPILIKVVTLAIRLLYGKGVFQRIEAAVIRWADKEIAGAEKREGILAELEVIGLTLAEWALRACIELAIGKLVDFDAKTQPTVDDYLIAKAATDTK